MLQLLYLTNTGYKLTYKICSVKAERTDRGSEKCVFVFLNNSSYTHFLTGIWKRKRFLLNL